MNGDVGFTMMVVSAALFLKVGGAILSAFAASVLLGALAELPPSRRWCQCVRKSALKTAKWLWFGEICPGVYIVYAILVCFLSLVIRTSKSRRTAIRAGLARLERPCSDCELAVDGLPQLGIPTCASCISQVTLPVR